MSDQLRDIVQPIGEVEPPLDLRTRIEERERLVAPRRSVGTPRLLVAIAAAAGVLLVLGILVVAAHSRYTAPPPRPTHKPPTSTVPRFHGLPPEGTGVSRPATGKLLLTMRSDAPPIMTWYLYADGRMVWQKWTGPPVAGDPLVVPQGADLLNTTYVQQRLSPQGVRLLRSKMLATGLFEHDFLSIRSAQPYVYYGALRGDRWVEVKWAEWGDSPETHARARALARLSRLIRPPFAWLPPSAWKNRQIRAYLPSHYQIAIDRGPLETSKLASPARQVIRQFRYLLHDHCQVITTGQARAILQAFAKAGVPLKANHSNGYLWDFAHLGHSNHAYLYMQPSPPKDSLLKGGQCSR